MPSDKEEKRARGALSCAECRRLKLKCNKSVPCSSCTRRGCSAICPNGSLITGQGTRFVLADTEKLHQKIAQMSDRIRQLEDALAILHSTQSTDPHPLLHPDFVKIKSSIELHSATNREEPAFLSQEVSPYINAFGSLAIRDDGSTTFYGRSAGSESLLIAESVSPLPCRTIHPDLRTLSDSFPFSIPPALQLSTDLNHLISSYLPPWPKACRLSELYLEQAHWFFGPVTEQQLYQEILPLWYPESPKSPSTTSSNSPSPSSVPHPTKGTAHELALIFVIFSFGSLTDVDLPAAPDNPEAELFYQVTKAVLALEPVLERPPSVATVQTLALMAIYEGLYNGENSTESTWALMGLATKLAQSIGLHRDCARWKLTPAEVQKRRVLFWELFITDCWLSLATGRLATFSLPYVDCELPFDHDQTISDDGTTQPSFPFWKARFGAECVSAVVQGTLTSQAPKYSCILELDRKVRDVDLPEYAQGAPPQGEGLARTMSHFMPKNYRELTLLYIHRCFFAHAISSHPRDPIKSQYAPSFLAGYRSACTILGSVRQQFALFPAQIARFWVLWTHAFSAAVMLASVVTHSSLSKVAPAALIELRMACELFQQASAYGGRAVKFLPIIQRLQTKASKAYVETNSGIPPSIPKDIFKPSTSDEGGDELSIFSGKTYTIRVSGSGPVARFARVLSASPQLQSQSQSPRVRGQGHQQQQQQCDAVSMTDHPSFEGVHPSLVSELRQFEGKITVRIRDAYHRGTGDDRGEVPMHGMGVTMREGREQERRQEGEMEMVRKEAMAGQAPRQPFHNQQVQYQQRQHQQVHDDYHCQQQEHYRLYPHHLETQRMEQQGRNQQQIENREFAYRQTPRFHVQDYCQQRHQPQVVIHPQYLHQYGQPSITHAPAATYVPDCHAYTHGSPQFSRGSLSHAQPLSSLHHQYTSHQGQYQCRPEHSLYTNHDHQHASPTESTLTSPVSTPTSHFQDVIYGGHLTRSQHQHSPQPTTKKYHDEQYSSPHNNRSVPIIERREPYLYMPETALL